MAHRQRSLGLERLVLLVGSGLGVRRRFTKTLLIPCGGDFLALAQTGSQSAGPGVSVPCVRHGSQAVDVDQGQLIYPSLERRRDRHRTARARPNAVGGPRANDNGGGSRGSPKFARIVRISPGSVITAMRRMSPPPFGHLRGNSSLTCAISFAQAIRDVS
jgi:hypothetical protein